MKSSVVQRSSHVFSPFWILSVCVGVVACGSTLDPEKVACKDSSQCPKGYACVLETGKDVGLCQTSGKDAGSVDVNGASGGGQDGGGSVIRGSGGSSGSGGSLSTGGTVGGSDSGAGGGGIYWPDALPPTDAPGSPAGTACTSNTQCSSGNCIDGVCCAATSCTGCFACSNALTGQPDGTCAPVANGKSGRDACTDETSTKPCGNDGTCDGKGACRKATAGKSCGVGSCNESSAYIPAPTCDGKGVCTPGTPQTCSPYPCLETGCDKKCTKQTDCDTGTYCDTTTGSCKATKANGATASETYECTSKIVADGVCCDQACTGCSACTAALNGQDSKTTGTCLPVKAKGAAPRNACPKGTDACGMDGTCDGSGKCYYPAVGSECGTKSCAVATSMLTKSTCDSDHTCKQATASCPGAMACLANGSDCRPAPCTGESDCASGSYCTSTGTCAAKSGAGSLCTPATASQCNGAACLDGHCCSAASCGTCQACTGTGGTCVAVTNAEDPDSCSGTKSCDAAGACKKKSGQACQQGTECLSGFCADNVCCDRACNGACEYCANAGSAGQCGYVTGAPKTGHPACAGDGSACQGTCKGGKADCDLPGSETVCRQPSCQGTSTQINRATCNGTGNCPAQSTSSCGSYLCSGSGCVSSCSGTGSGQCASGTACVDNKCKTCDNGLTACGSSCADLKTDVLNCGTCGKICPSYAPYCSNGSCVGCTGNTQCTSKGYAACSSAGTCVCVQKDANNLLENPGFDGSASSWTLSAGAAYSAEDANGCPGSGSVALEPLGMVSRCLTTIPAGVTSVRMGGQYKGGGGQESPALCYVTFYANNICDDPDNALLTYAFGGYSSATWAPTSVETTAVPGGTRSISVKCQCRSVAVSFDQLFLNAGTGSF